MRSTIVFLVLFVSAALAAPRRRPGLGLFGSTAASAGIGIGSMATDLGTNFASQTLGAAGQMLSGIPLLGPLAQMGTGLGQAGIKLGNSIAQTSLGVAQAAVQAHAAPKPATQTPADMARRPVAPQKEPVVETSEESPELDQEAQSNQYWQNVNYFDYSDEV